MSSQHPDDSLLKEYDGKTAPAVSSILLRQMTLAITIFFESIIEHMVRKVNINASYRDLSIVLISPSAVRSAALHQPAEGLRVELSQLLCASRPLEPAVVQPLIQQYIAVAGIIQGFDPICSPSAEQKQTLLIQFCSILPQHNLRQTVYTAAYVRISARDVVIPYNGIYAGPGSHDRQTWQRVIRSRDPVCFGSSRP